MTKQNDKTMISIVIPHYNTPDRLRCLLRSIGEYEDVQIIVADDRSDANLTALEACRQEYEDRILFLRNDGGVKSAGTARNIALEHAKGQWLLFADADDLFLDGWHETVSRYLASPYDMVFFPPVSQGQGPSALSRRHLPYARMVYDYLNGCSGGEEHLRFHFVVPWSKMIRRELVRAHTLRFEETPRSNDVMFSVRAGYHARGIAADEHPIYMVTERKGSLTAEESEEAYLQRLQIECERDQFLRENLSRAQRLACGRMSGLPFLKKAVERGYSVAALRACAALLRDSRIPPLALDRESLRICFRKA